MYSQNLEQQYIMQACADAARRKVLDIGAYHPTQLSNSRALIEAGWEAVLIEPSPGPIRGLVDEYGKNPKITVVAAAVALNAGLIEMNISDDAVSTTERANWQRWQGQASFLGAMLVPAVTIPDILTRFGAFDCVSIDSEGTSVDLLRALLATEMFPRCVVCEYDDRLNEALDIAYARDYQMTYKSTENLVLVHG